jgi:YesN/AraC family two-component response regulator
MYYGRDIGDYFLSAYISIVIYITSYRVVSSSSFFSENESFLDIISRKYSKSSLTELEKIEIEKKILFEMEVNKFYKESTASLQVLSKRIHIKPHNISQVLNEKMKNSFFELISYYRVEEAKQIFREDRNNNYTIEIISEMVGYNSKTAFVNAFKKYTNKTPSEYRKIEL